MHRHITHLVAIFLVNVLNAEALSTTVVARASQNLMTLLSAATVDMSMSSRSVLTLSGSLSTTIKVIYLLMHLLVQWQIQNVPNGSTPLRTCSASP